MKKIFLSIFIFLIVFSLSSCNFLGFNNEDDDFIITSGELFGYKGKKGAEKLLADANALFAGGELAEEDKDALMFALQQSYIDAKRKNKKYAHKKSEDEE